MSNQIIQALQGHARFEEREVKGLCTVNILKPTLEQLKEIELLFNIEGETPEDIARNADFGKIIKKIGLEYIVDDKCNAVFDEENISILTGADGQVQMSLIDEFKSVFEKVANTTAAKVEKKRSGRK